MDLKKNEKHTSQSNVLKRMLAASPAAVGFGITLNDLYQQNKKGFSVINRASPIVAAARNSGSHIGKPVRATRDFMNTHADFFRTEAGAGIARQAWQTAVQSAAPNSQEMLSFAGDIMGMPGSDVAPAIEQTLNRNNSLFMNKVFTRFKTNISALSNHYNIAKGIPKFKTVSDLAFEPPTPVHISNLPQELHAAYSNIQKTLNAHGTVMFQTRKEWAQEGYGQYLFNFNHRGRNIKLTVPVSQNGIMIEGNTLSSRRIAPDVQLFDPTSRKATQRMSRHEFFMRNFQESIMPDIVSGKLGSEGEIRRAIGEMYKQDIYGLENVPNVPHSINHPGWKQYENIGSKSVDLKVLDSNRSANQSQLFRSKFRSVSDRELGPAMEATGLFPSTSPSAIAEGRLSSFDASKWAINDAAVDFSRRPSQARREWKATHKAVGAMLSSGNTKWSVFETQAWRQEMGNYAAPHVRTVYIDPSKHSSLLESMVMGEGESLLSHTKALQDMGEVSRIAHPIHMKSIREDLKSRIGGGEAFSPGEVLGFDVEGLPVQYQSNMKLKDLVENETKGKGQFMSLFYEETHHMTESEKMFKDIKAMERRTQDGYKIDRQIAKQTTNKIFTENVNRWANMDELKKDRAKHSTQMITAMWDVLDQTRTRDFVQRNKRLASFMRNPQATAELFKKRATMNGTYSHESFTKQLIELGMQQGRLTPDEFGNVFGALPVVFGDKAKELVPNERYYNATSHGFAGGISQATFGGTKELTGAGAQGSLEPRAFELLSGGQYGPLGEQITQELSTRLVQGNPGTLSAHNALTRTLNSVAGRVKPRGDAIHDISSGYSRDTFQDFIERGGGFLRVGKGQNDVYVPGSGDLDAMTPFMTGAGQKTSGDLADMYHSLAEQGAYLHSNAEPSDIGDYRRSLDQFVRDIGKQQAPGGKGAGAILRGKLPGSRFLTGVSSAAGVAMENPMTVGIPENYAASMFREMHESGLHDPEGLKAMEARAMGGEEFGGMVARHPFIGPYSLQPVNMKVIKGHKAPTMVLPSRMVDVMMKGQANASPLNLSPMVGMAGDLDADTYSAMLVSPDLEKNIRRNFTQADNEYTRAFMEHNVRAQLIKAKNPGASGEGLSQMMNRIAQAKKLGTAQSWTPKLSVSLSNARSAVGSRMHGQEAADAAFLLQWLEQVPISGKHLKAQDVLSDKMSSSFQQIASAIDERQPERLESAVRSILGESSETTRSLLNENVSIASGADQIRKITGIHSFRDELPGINLSQTAQNITRAMGEGASNGVSEAAEMLAGRKALNTGSLAKYMNILEKPMAQGLAHFSTMNLALKNVMSAAGAAVIKNHKAIGFGFLGSLALGAVLSNPRDSIGPGSAGIANARVNMNPERAAERMSPESLHPQSPGVGNPSVPDMMVSPTAHLMPGGESTQAQVRAQSMNRSQTNSMVQGSRSLHSNTVTVNIRDNRRSLDPDRVINKLL